MSAPEPRRDDASSEPAVVGPADAGAAPADPGPAGSGPADPGPAVTGLPPAASRSARRPVMWLATAGIVAAVAVTFVVGPRAGALLLAVLLAVLAVIRLVSPAPGPYGISARSRAFDVLSLLVTSAVIGTLALIADNV